MKEQTIVLDCPPGLPRPGDLLETVIENTGLPLREPVSKVFGAWTWDYSDISPDKWKQICPILKEKIVDLYNRGLIRYGAW